MAFESPICWKQRDNITISNEIVHVALIITSFGKHNCTKLQRKLCHKIQYIDIFIKFQNDSFSTPLSRIISSKFF